MLLEHQLIYFMNTTVLPFGLAVFVMERWDPGDRYVKENEQHCVVDLGWAKLTHGSTLYFLQQDVPLAPYLWHINQEP